MLIEAKQLIGLPVAAEDTQSKIGKVFQVLIDPENGRVLGFEVVSGGIFAPKRVLSITDVREWDPNGIVTATIENLVDPQEIIRINEIIKKNIYFLGMKAKTENGKGLGVVDDLLIDTETESVVKYYLKDLINSRVLTADKVTKIDKHIIFSDDIAEIPPGAAGVTA
ncbi:MAG: PRC-barrel protein [Candidatus Berkelbacteria bacterium]|nr:PRC-barrel protein [Candidatus Berkelbacteria bacterium]